MHGHRHQQNELYRIPPALCDELADWVSQQHPPQIP
jgi:hypothetical protein